MGYCSKCGSQLNPDANFCPVCGQPVAITEDSIEELNDESSETTDNESSEKQAKSSFGGVLLLFGGFLVLSLIITRIFCHINPNEDYSFISAIWHGLFIIPNYILSLFTETVIKAENQSSVYNILFWATGLVIMGGWLFNLFIFIRSLFTKDEEPE